jgi:hypothetical protein
VVKLDIKDSETVFKLNMVAWWWCGQLKRMLAAWEPSVAAVSQRISRSLGQVDHPVRQWRPSVVRVCRWLHDVVGTVIRISTSIVHDSSRGDIRGTSACSSTRRTRNSVCSRPLAYRDGGVPLMLDVHGELATKIFIYIVDSHSTRHPTFSTKIFIKLSH